MGLISRMKKQRAALKLFRATRNYYGFTHLYEAPKGLKRWCYLYGEQWPFEGSDGAMKQLSSAKSWRVYKDVVYKHIIDSEALFVRGGIYDSFASYSLCHSYLIKLLMYTRAFPITWFCVFRLHI